MLEWKRLTGDDMLQKEISRTKRMFNNWYESYWEHRCSLEVMLSEKSPVESVYVKMTKPFNVVKEKYPKLARVQCSSCHQYKDVVVGVGLNQCHEYACEFNICEDCLNLLGEIIKEPSN